MIYPSPDTYSFGHAFDAVETCVVLPFLRKKWSLQSVDRGGKYRKKVGIFQEVCSFGKLVSNYATVPDHRPAFAGNKTCNRVDAHREVPDNESWQAVKSGELVRSTFALIWRHEVHMFGNSNVTKQCSEA